MELELTQKEESIEEDGKENGTENKQKICLITARCLMNEENFVNAELKSTLGGCP